MRRSGVQEAQTDDQRALYELALYESVRLGSGRAFRRLVDQHGPGMLRVARWYRPDEDDARRLVRQAWITALGGLDMFTWHTSFRAWLFGILLHHCRGTQVGAQRADVAVAVPRRPPRAAHRQPQPSGDWQDLPWSPAWSPESWGVVDDALAALPLPSREAVQFRDVEGWDSGEVCDVLGLTGAEELGVLHAGRTRLAAALAEHLGLDGCGEARCGWAAVTATAYLEGRLPADQRRTYEAHLSHCGACGCQLQQLRGVAAMLALRSTPDGSVAADPALEAAFRRWRVTRGLRPWRRLPMWWPP
ncbi:MAG: zf-HC2 domain-containing protein [Actinomycetota bacterium]|nr:zf-HC2 domain-containing protein [Actinomycetota bacterium]